MNSTDRIFYIMGLVLLGGLVMVEILAAAGVLTLTDLGFSCSFLLACASKAKVDCERITDIDKITAATDRRFFVLLPAKNLPSLFLQIL